MAPSPLAGKPAPRSLCINVAKLISAYYALKPDPEIVGQRVAFGTSGHRGCAFDGSFNENHILAITQAICDYRAQQQVTGPLFLGIDTHALSEPALVSALEVLAANGVTVMLAVNDEYTPTPAVSHAILKYNAGRNFGLDSGIGTGLADGIVITPSHNPPQDGGFKYNFTNGGPADTNITAVIEAKANEFLQNNLTAVKRMPYERALRASSTQRYDYLNSYVADLGNVLDMEVIQNSNLALGVDPLGGAGVHYWGAIAERYKINLRVVNEIVDPTFSFMSVDWDGQIRMDPSSSFAMQSLLKLKDSFDVAFACDTDHDRHGIVTRGAGLMAPNQYLCAAIYYLFQNRPAWKKTLGIGKTIVSSQMIDRVAQKLGVQLFEVPVGFKWFVSGLLDHSLGFVGEESAGAAFAKRDGSTWTTDKDGITMALLAAEMTARLGKDPAQIYADITKELGNSVYGRIEAKASAAQKSALKNLNPQQVLAQELAGEPITSILTTAPGSKILGAGAAFGGLKVSTANGWFAARPSGTEDIYKIYAESFTGAEHLQKIQQHAQELVSRVFSQTTGPSKAAK